MSDEEENKKEISKLQKAKQKLELFLQKIKASSERLDKHAIELKEWLAKFKTPLKWLKLILWGLVALALAAIAYVAFLGVWHLIAKIHFLFFATEISNLPDETKKDNFNELRNALFILAALIGAPFLVWRTIIAQSQAETARDRAYTELFTKAIEQLGAEKPKKENVLDEDGKSIIYETYVPNIEVRIGAIYALERIMNDSEKDAPAIVDTLAAYVRENCGEPQALECKIPQQKEDQSIGDWLSAIKVYIGNIYSPSEGTLIARARALKNASTNRSDIKTALTVIGRRPLWLKEPEHFKSQETQMTDLQSINFQGWNLTNFDLSYCNLSNAKMQGAEMTQAQMKGSDMTQAQMQGARMYFAEMLRANMNHAQMQGVTMDHAEMKGATMNHAEMHGAHMYNAQMKGATMNHAEMQGAEMNYAKMQGAVMNGAHMQGAVMNGAQMQGADMRHAKISEVQVTEAQKTAASVIWVDFTKASFEFDELQAQLPGMFGHKKLTILPKGMDIPEHWSKADMDTIEGRNEYNHEWEDFKKKMGVE